MGHLRYLMIHCTATPKDRHVTKAEIIQWHTAPKHQGGRGWKQVGYSDMIHQDGRLENLVPFNQNHQVEGWELTNGARGMNQHTRHVVYVGGVIKSTTKGLRPYDTRTQAQRQTLATYVRYMILRHPQLQILGHNQVALKACPSFDVQQWLQAIGIPVKHQYTLKT